MTGSFLYKTTLQSSPGMNSNFTTDMVEDKEAGINRLSDKLNGSDVVRMKACITFTTFGPQGADNRAVRHCSVVPCDKCAALYLGIQRLKLFLISSRDISVWGLKSPWSIQTCKIHSQWHSCVSKIVLLCSHPRVARPFLAQGPG